MTMHVPVLKTILRSRKKLESIVDRVIINRHKKGKEAEAKVQERDKTKVKKIRPKRSKS